MQPVDLFVEAPDGLRLHVVEFQPGGQPELLLVHGSFGLARQWDPLVPHLPESRRILALDLAGHGDSGHGQSEERYAFTALVADLLAVIRELSLRPIVIGHSVGSALAMQLAAAHGDAVAAAVLMDIDPDLPAEQAEHLNEVGRRPPRRYRTLEEAIERERRIAPEAPPPLHQHLASHAYRRAADGAWEQKFDQAFLRSIRPWRNVPSLASIQVPLLVLRGERTVVMSDEGFHALTRIPPHARGEVIPGTGHQLHLERPEAVGGAISRFVAEISGEGTAR